MRPCHARRGSLSLALAATESWWPGRRLQPRSRRNRGGHGFQVPTANHGSRTGPGPRSRRQPGVTSRQVNCRPLQAQSAGVSGAGTMCPNLDLPVIRASVSGPDRAFGTRRLGHLNLPPARQVTVGAQAGMTLTILNQMSVLPSRLHGLGSCKNRGSGWAPGRRPFLSSQPVEEFKQFIICRAEPRRSQRPSNEKRYIRMFIGLSNSVRGHKQVV